jgi:hypothetical protein
LDVVAGCPAGVVVMPAGSPAAGPGLELAAVEDDVVAPPVSPESFPDLSPDEPQAAVRTISRIRADFFTP